MASYPPAARIFEPSRKFVPNARASVGTPILVPPFTMACWFNVGAAGVTETLMWMGASGPTQQYHAMFAVGSSLIVQAQTVAGGFPKASTTTTYSTDQWAHACGVWSATNLRAAYLNGGGKGTDTTNAFPSGATPGLALGRLNDSSPSNYMTGRLFWPCFWRVALNDAEVRLLGTGTPPWEIRPESIYSMPNLTNLSDPFLRLNWTNSGSVQAAPYKAWTPPRRVFKAPAAVGGGGLLRFPGMDGRCNIPTMTGGFSG